ncbi:DUF3515 domain-containing protein [Streptomyces sp. NPDC101118]|uniref:DUF3515 domain-containing protein n=1 Tax=Streptomyces sp. NPDC101118 TaxID=3366109 RepID=UPI00381C97D3
MTFSRLRPLCLPVLAACLALAGCTPGSARAEVTPPPAPPADVVAMCSALHGALPETVAGLDREDPEPSSDLTAAWGGAAIVLRCGVPKPLDLISDAQSTGQVEVNGVGWLIGKRRDDGSFRFVTGGRLAYVEVVVDREHATDAGLLVAFGPAVEKSVPVGISSY